MNNMDKMLQAASQNLGMSPEALKESLGKGDLSAIFSNMSESDAEKLKSALKNPEVSKKLSESPEMAEYMKKVNGDIS